MEIKIRKAEKQQQDSDFIRIEAKLVATDYTGITECSWSFRSTDTSTLLIHSGDAYEDIFLTYQEMFNATLEIKLPDDLEHEIVILAKTITPTDGLVPIVKLDDAGNPHEVMEENIIRNEESFISNPITIKKFKVTEAWV
jgi:hypothetical protein